MVSLVDLKKGKFDYLAHTTHPYSLIPILEEGYILTSADLSIDADEGLTFKGIDIGSKTQWGNTYPGVYTSLVDTKGKKRIFEQNSGVYLVLSLDVLHNQNNFHMSADFSHGLFEETYYPEEYLEFNEIMADEDNNEYGNNEVVFHDKLSLNYLRFIVLDDEALLQNYEEETSISYFLTQLKKSKKLKKYIPLIISKEEFEGLKIRKLIDSPKVRMKSKDPLYSPDSRKGRCIPFEFYRTEYLAKELMRNNIKDATDPTNKPRLLKLVNQCGVREKLDKKGVNLNKKKLSVKDVKFISDAVMERYEDYMREKYSSSSSKK